MASIKGKDTQVELILRRALHKEGYRFHVNSKLHGKPDIVFPRQKVAIFVDGDFWHGYNWKVHGKKPPKGFWQNKINNNITRDKKVNNELRKEGWLVLRFWEHDVRDKFNLIVDKIGNLILKRHI